MMLFMESIYAYATLTEAVTLVSYLVIVYYVPGTVQSTLQSFPHLSVFRPVVDA